MRQTFIKALVECAENDESIYLLVADMGYGMVEPFSKKFPDRFINVGIAEQNMIGIATGLALSGKKVFCYSIGNFPTMRCLEQIRNDACYHNVDITIVSGNTGLTYGQLGSSHHSLEDMSILRSLPNITICCPADKVETELITKSIKNGVHYLRLGKTTEETIYIKRPELKIGQAIKLRDGDDITIIATGTMLIRALQASDKLVSQDIHARVLSMHTVKPLDTYAIYDAIKNTKGIITIEEHSIVGGLGSEVAELLAEYGSPVKFKRLGLPNEFITKVASQDTLLSFNGLTVNGIITESKRMICG